MPSYDRQKDESAKAFGAFCYYRDKGPDRSLDRAWGDYKDANGITNGRKRCPTHWQKWSKLWKWTARAASYDAYVHQQQIAMRMAKLKELEERRCEFELRDQPRTEKQVRILSEIIEKAALAPITDVIRETVDDKGNVSRTKVKGINLAGVARIAHETNETARIASQGHRSSERHGEQENNDELGVVWMESTANDEK